MVRRIGGGSGGYGLSRYSDSRRRRLIAQGAAEVPEVPPGPVVPVAEDAPLPVPPASAVAPTVPAPLLDATPETVETSRSTEDVEPSLRVIPGPRKPASSPTANPHRSIHFETISYVVDSEQSIAAEGSSAASPASPAVASPAAVSPATVSPATVSPAAVSPAAPALVPPGKSTKKPLSNKKLPRTKSPSAALPPEPPPVQLMSPLEVTPQLITPQLLAPQSLTPQLDPSPLAAGPSATTPAPRSAAPAGSPPTPGQRSFSSTLASSLQVAGSRAASAAPPSRRDERTQPISAEEIPATNVAATAAGVAPLAPVAAPIRFQEIAEETVVTTPQPTGQIHDPLVAVLLEERDDVDLLPPTHTRLVPRSLSPFPAAPSAAGPSAATLSTTPPSQPRTPRLRTDLDEKPSSSPQRSGSQRGGDGSNELQSASPATSVATAPAPKSDSATQLVAEKEGPLVIPPETLAPRAGLFDLGDPQRFVHRELCPGMATVAHLLKLSQPVTWVFTGDSMAPSTLPTHGWRSYPELFQDYLRSELRRLLDVVINTSTAGERATALLKHLDWRVLRFQPDVVLLLVGISDARSGMGGRMVFRRTLSELVGRIQETGGIPILQTPNFVQLTSDLTPGDLPGYVDIIRDVAVTSEVPLIDHWEHWQRLKADPPALAEWLADGILHPNPDGHREMTALISHEFGFSPPHP